MIREALEYLIKLRAPELHVIDDRQYSDKELAAIQAPLVAPVQVGTLTGLVGIIEAELENLTPEQIFVHVVSHTEVRVLDLVSDIWQRRTELARATWNDPVKFPFGSFLAPEEFVIRLQSGFDVDQSTDLTTLIQLCSNLATEAVATAIDDGIAQTATVRRGVLTKDIARIKPRVKLAPFRMFREVEQIESEFLFRLRGGDEDEPPTCALFEADGGKWRLDAVQKVREWMVEKLANSSLDNASDIPVVA